MSEAFMRGILHARAEFAKVWSKMTGREVHETDFTAEYLRNQLDARWLERRVLSDGAIPIVGLRVVTVREVAERWGMPHGHSDLVHEITSLLGGTCGLVECGPTQINVGMLRVAPAGSEVTCKSCRGWREFLANMRVDAEVFRERQVAERLAEPDAERDRLRKRVRELELRIRELESGGAS